jgi:hypothetical protein
MRKLVAVAAVIVILAGCFGESEPDTAAERKMESMNNAMDAGTFPLSLDQSTTEDIVEYMGRSVDGIAAGSGDFRKLQFEMEDGSILYFAMKPAPGGGLVLDHFTAEE